jgi:hypothetical protein
MEARPLAQAKARLMLCRRALDELGKHKFDEALFQMHWQDFLVQWKGTYMKVQQAAKTTPQEVQWFGGVNAIRRNDPLLRWLYEARNDEEHFGATDSATKRPATIEFKVVKANPGGGITFRLSDLRNPETGELVGTDKRLRPGVAVLHEVTERDGIRKVPPPTSHLGKPMQNHPTVAATLGLQWLEALVAKAEETNKP